KLHLPLENAPTNIMNLREKWMYLIVPADCHQNDFNRPFDTRYLWRNFYKPDLDQLLTANKWEKYLDLIHKDSLLGLRTPSELEDFISQKHAMCKQILLSNKNIEVKGIYVLNVRTTNIGYSQENERASNAYAIEIA